MAKAYASSPWWYDLRGVLLLTFGFRGNLWEQVRFFGANVGGRHLEAAIGTGGLFSLVLRWRRWKHLAPSRVDGFDFSPTLIAGAVRRFRKDPSITLQRADVVSLPYPDNTFDSVNIANAVHCFPDLQQALREIHRVLRPGGRLALNGLLHPQDNGLLGWVTETLNRWARQKGIVQSIYLREDLQRHLRSLGFDVLKEKQSGNGFFAVLRKPNPQTFQTPPPAALLDRLRPLGLAEPEPYWASAFGRTIGAISQGELQRLSHARIAIPGLGGAGGIHLITMVRAGIGRFHIADFDAFSIVNFNRQYGARVDTIGCSKIEVMKRDALEINPFLDIQTFPEGVNRENLDRFLQGVDVVMDALDFFALKTRRAVFNRARELGIPVITSAPIGFGSATMFFSPTGMGFDEYFDIHDDTPEFEAILRFYIGLLPDQAHRRYGESRHIRLEAKSGPSLSVGVSLISATAGTEVLRVLLDRPGAKPIPHYRLVDLYLGQQFEGRLRWGNRGWLQRMKLVVARSTMRSKILAFRPWMKAPEWDRRGPVPSDVWTYILNAALQAPSRDNTQPFRLVRDGDSIHLWPDFEKDRSYFNVRDIATWVAVGSAAENIQVAASAFGFSSEVVGPTSTDERVTVRLTQAHRTWDPLGEAIWDRETNRRLYRREPVSPEVLERLAGETHSFSGVRLSMVTETRAIRRLGEAVFASTRAGTRIPVIHADLQKRLRERAFESTEGGDGFTIKNYNPAGILGHIFLRVTRRPALFKLFRLLGVGYWIAAAKRRSILHSGAVGLLTTSQNSAEGFFTAGRALQRIWLAATVSDLAVQPVSNLPLFVMRRRWEGDASIPSDAREDIRKAETIAAEIYPAMQEGKETPVLLLRFGKAPYVDAGTFRRPLASFLPSPPKK